MGVLKKIILLASLAILAFVIYFLVSKKVNSIDTLKRSVFEATHDRDKVDEQVAFNIAYNAYLWGFVRVKSMLLQKKAIHPDYHDYAPINTFAISKELAKPGFTDFTPNSDTYYGLAWLDVSKGPIIIEIPEVSNKYWTVQATDASLNTFNYLGSRMGTTPGKWAYCKFDWNGTLPTGIQRIDCPTNQVFLQARNLVFPGNKEDEKAVYALMMKYKLYPMDSVAQYASIPKTETMVNPLNSNPDLRNLNFFKLLNEAITFDPPVAVDKGLVSTFAKLGIGPNLTFDEAKLSKSQKAGLEDGIMAAFRRMYDELKFGGERKGGFNFRYDLGKYDFNYHIGSAVAFYGYGANTAEEAVYVNTIVDADGDDLIGSKKYKIHFAKDEFPPVNAFWSITMYSRPENQLIENEINRYNIGGLTPNLKYNADGSLDILIQHDRPTDISNWLPAPKGDFWLIMRMYDPKKEVLDNKYTAPTVDRQ